MNESSNISFFRGGQVKIIKGEWTNYIPVETIDLLILDPPFDYDYNLLFKLNASVIAVFSRGHFAFNYLTKKIKEGYGYHSLVNLTPANGVNAPTLPSNTFEIIHILRKGKCMFDHNYALSVLGKSGKKASGVLNFGRPTTGSEFYKYAKPKKVIAYLCAYIPEGGKIYDPFCGIGTGANAAIARDCYYIGTDISDVAKKIRRENLFTNVEYLNF
jgi:hypothetical protein